MNDHPPPENKRRAAGNGPAKLEPTKLRPTLFRILESCKDEPQVTRFHSSLALFIRQLRQQLREGRR